MMKKIMALLSVVVLAIGMLAGCGSSSSKIEEGITTKGKQVTIIYAENPTTGYTWVYEISDENIVKAVSDEYTADENKEQVVGKGGMHTFVFEGVGEGTATITMTEKQNWDGGEEGESKTIQITVDANGNITDAK